MALRCGIDLGTTYSAVSWYDSFNNRVETIDLETADGQKLLRSVVYYPEGGDPPVVGDTAWNAKRKYDERVVAGIKRSMGTSFTMAPIDGKEYSPAEVSAEILKVLVQDAALFLGEAVEDVVITVPAYFGDAERAATEEAGKIAGLNVLALLPEPHAAALAFSVEKVSEITDKYLLVYDLGGGTFDVTLIRATSSPDSENAISLRVDTLCKDGNAHLGGLDWDRVLAELVAEKIQQEHGVDVWENTENEHIRLDNCEKAKRNLTRTGNVNIIGDLANHEVEVTVAEFEDHTRDLLEQTRALLEKVLEDAETDHGVKKDEIKVMLTGGSSRMPMVRKMIESVTGKPPLVHRNPELLVTIGAAYWAHLLQPDTKVVVPVTQNDGTVTPTDVSVGGLTDVSTYAVGVAVFRPDGHGGLVKQNAVIIPKGETFGVDFEKEFATSEDNMTEIPVMLYKGDSADLADCLPLMEVHITGLPPNRPQGRIVKVTLRFDMNGIIRGRAVDADTNTEVEIVIDRNV